jgi:16S rRNA (uracil1498-N3)-methyltransferase
MHRFFVDPQILKAQPIVLTGSQAHQVRKVLRLRPGDRVILLDNCGLACEAQLTGYRADQATFELLRSWVASGDPRLHLTLYQAVLKGERFEWVLQKGTELGIGRFVPLVCARNVVEDEQAIRQKLERWKRIILEAAEQSGRVRLPELSQSVTFFDAIRETPAGEFGRTDREGVRLIAWEGERATGLRGVLSECNLASKSRIQVFVGPEGGFTEDEVRSAQDAGIRPVSLGPRILRAETAGLVTAAAIFYESGDMAPRLAEETT